MYGELRLIGIADEEVLPLRRHFSSPACHRIVIDGEARVGDDQTVVNAYDLPEAFALGAGTDGVVEAEHLGRRLLEDPTIGFEDIAELLEAYRLSSCLGHLFDSEIADATPLEEGRLYRFA